MTSPDEPVPFRITRRRFIAVTAAGLGVVAAASGLPGCGSDGEDDSAGAADEPPAYVDYSPVPPTPMAPPPAGLQFFTAPEAATLDALTARILPGDAGDPGAHEAGAVGYIDHLMASTKTGSAQATYVEGPFAKPYEGASPPPPGPDDVPVKKDQLDRYGPQSRLTPREVYRKGLASLDAAAMAIGGQPFVDLPVATQDALLDALDADAAPGFDSPSAKSFFDTVRQHVIEGVFSDPVYGGNRDMVGWRLIGYPGIWRAWNTDDMKGRTPLRPPQSITMLHGFEEGYPVGGAIEPVSGSDLKEG